MSDGMNVKLAGAMTLAIQDFRVFPLHDMASGQCSCDRGASCKEGGKHPRISAWPSNATKNRKQVERWWTQWPDANIGIATGSTSGLFVIDIDDKDGQTKLKELLGELPTPTAFSARGMPHYWFSFPEGANITNRRGGLPLGVDVRGNGGFIIAPPSISYKGEYRFNNSTIANLIEPSEKLLKLLEPTVDESKLVDVSKVKKHKDLSKSKQERYETYWDRAYVENIKKIEELGPGDQWNHVLYTSSLRLFELLKAPWIPEDDFEAIRDDILDACAGNYDTEGWDRERCMRTINSALTHVNQDNKVLPEPASLTEEKTKPKEDWPELEDRFREALRASFVKAVDIKEVEEQTFLWEDWISAGEFCLIAGDGGVGKGCLVTWLMSQLSRGLLPGKFEGKPVHSVFVSTEETYNRHTTPRLIAQGYDPRYVTFIDVSLFEKQSVELDAPTGLTLDKWKTKIMFDEFAAMGVSLVVFDPITGFLPDKTNQNDSMDVRRVLTPLNVYGQEHDITVIGIQHVNKGASSSASDKVNGSTSWRNVARSGLYLAKHVGDDDFDRIVNQLKGNYSAEQGGFTYRIEEKVVKDPSGKSIKTQMFVRGKNVDITADETVQKNSLTTKEAAFEMKAQTKAELSLVRMLLPLGSEGFNPGGGQRSMFAKGVGVSEETIRKALKELCNMGIAENTGAKGKTGIWRVVNEQAAKDYIKTVESGITNSFEKIEGDLEM